MIPRRARKVDENQAGLVRALRELPGVGVLVWNGDVDLIVGRGGRTYLLEVKPPRQPPSRRDRSLKQAELRARWPGHYAVVSSVEEALVAIGVGIEAP